MLELVYSYEIIMINNMQSTKLLRKFSTEFTMLIIPAMVADGACKVSVISALSFKRN